MSNSRGLHIEIFLDNNCGNLEAPTPVPSKGELEIINLKVLSLGNPQDKIENISPFSSVVNGKKHVGRSSQEKFLTKGLSSKGRGVSFYPIRGLRCTICLKL